MLTLAPATFAQPRNEQRPDSFVDAASVAPGLVVEARYATAHNFVGVPIDGYEKPLCYLTRPAARRWRRLCRISKRVGSRSRCTIATGRSGRSRISCAGRATSAT